jgi:hypothetical protein
MQASWGVALVSHPNSPLLSPTFTSSFGFALTILPSMPKSTKHSRNAETQPQAIISSLAGLHNLHLYSHHSLNTANGDVEGSGIHEKETGKSNADDRRARAQPSLAGVDIDLEAQRKSFCRFPCLPFL